MDIKALEKAVRELKPQMKDRYHLITEKEKEILTKTVKLNEEVGELCNDILSVLRLQRRSKLEKFKKSHIYQEFADVLIVTIQLAIASGVDIERAVTDKLERLRQRSIKEMLPR